MVLAVRPTPIESVSLLPKVVLQIMNSSCSTFKKESKRSVIFLLLSFLLVPVTLAAMIVPLTLLQQSKENLQRHPWGKIPSITFPDGFTLYENRAICKYLAKKYSFPLLPAESDAEAAALFDQSQSEEVLYFAEPAGRIAFEKFAKKFMGLPPNEAVVLDALRAVEAFLDVAERLLEFKSYMAGNEFTLTDIYYIPLIQRLFACGHGDIITSRKAVSEWWERVVNRPAIQKLLAADREAMAAFAAARQ